MVSPTKLALIVASALGAVSAVPAAAPSPESSVPGVAGSTVAIADVAEKRDLHKRATVQFQAYENTNYGGASLVISVNDNSCFAFTGVWAGWNDRISSAKTLTNGWSCYIYDTTNCSGDRGGPITTGNPHPNLHVYGWGDRTSSIKCI
ncbi:hypothetical protein B0T11DRAFT_325730 [Plectosphaerella cucumerina]|uniref:Beta/gamma crystallin n=1 Tax=Plectosphaerella cucumerina TaxID=40658 RepID=A0A8K0TI05_9PEZI|nr:hypothetical protein B0T11DRAFT_325730 [Plectosphaerella cucumerina]